MSLFVVDWFDIRQHFQVRQTLLCENIDREKLILVLTTLRSTYQLAAGYEKHPSLRIYFKSKAEALLRAALAQERSDFCLMSKPSFLMSFQKHAEAVVYLEVALESGCGRVLFVNVIESVHFKTVANLDIVKLIKEFDDLSIRPIEVPLVVLGWYMLCRCYQTLRTERNVRRVFDDIVKVRRESTMNPLCT